MCRVFVFIKCHHFGLLFLFLAPNWKTLQTCSAQSRVKCWAATVFAELLQPLHFENEHAHLQSLYQRTNREWSDVRMFQMLVKRRRKTTTFAIELCSGFFVCIVRPVTVFLVSTWCVSFMRLLESWKKFTLLCLKKQCLWERSMTLDLVCIACVCSRCVCLCLHYHHVADCGLPNF